MLTVSGLLTIGNTDAGNREVGHEDHADVDDCAASSMTSLTLFGDVRRHCNSIVT